MPIRAPYSPSCFPSHKVIHPCLASPRWLRHAPLDARSTRVFLTLLCAVAFCPTRARAQLTLVYVDSTLPKPPGAIEDGTQWSTAFRDLQSGIDAAESAVGGARVLVAQGEYRPLTPSGQSRTYLLDAGLDVEVIGGFIGFRAQTFNPPFVPSTDPDNPDGSARLCVIDGSPIPGANGAPTIPAAYHVVTLEGVDFATRAVRNPTVTGGQATGSNPDDSGGGMYLRASGTFVVDGCSVVSNRAVAFGGGISTGTNATDAEIRIRSSFISHNRSDERGGGIALQVGTDLVIGNCVMRSNRADIEGGGIYIGQQGGLVCNNTLLDNNFAIQRGGASQWTPVRANNPNGDRTVRMTHCTLTANSLLALMDVNGNILPNPNRGAGIHVNPGGQALSSKLLFLDNSISYDNSFGSDLVVEGDAPSGISGATAVVRFSNLGTSTSPGTSAPGGVALGAGVISAPPFFVDAANFDFRLDATPPTPSPCIDAGDNVIVGPDLVDIDDDDVFAEPLPLSLGLNARIVNGTADMGRYEQ